MEKEKPDPAKPSNNGAATKGVAGEIKKRLHREMAELARRAKGDDDQVPDDAEFQARYPLLWEWFCCTKLAERWRKLPPSIRISRNGCTIQASLSDESLKTSVSGVGATVQAALEALEANMSRPETWTTWRKRGDSLKEIEKGK